MTDAISSVAAFDHLSTVIGALLEDHAHRAVTPGKLDPAILAADLLELGQDIAVLAAAMQVLNRRADWTSPPLQAFVAS